MQLYIYNPNRELTGIVESFEYLRWTRRYSQCGSFELKAIATQENTALLKEGNIIWKNDDEEAGIIEHLELSQSEHETITASGRFATSLLARRILWQTEILSGDLSVCVEQLLNNNIISPTDTERQITGISFSSPNLGIPVSTQISYRNLMDSVTELCASSDIGIKTVFTPATGIFTVMLYNGANSQAVFSKEYENLTEQIYTESVADYANTALIGGEGEGAGRTFVAITSGSGETRREIFVDAKDLRAEDFGTDYVNTLTFRGQSKLNEQAIRYTFDTSVNPHGNLTYKIDFDLGQTVKVISKAWGVSMTTRITEIEETYDADGQSISVVFGKAELTIAQKVRSDMSEVKTALLAPTGISEVAEALSVVEGTLGDLAQVDPKIQGDDVADTFNNLFGKLPALEIFVGPGTISVGQYALYNMVPGDTLYFTSYSGNKFSDQPSENGHVFLTKHNGDNTGYGYQRAMGFFISRDTMTFYVISVFVFNNLSGQANWLNINNEPITTTRLANGAVTGVKIADRTITASKISSAFTDYSTTEQNTGRLWIDGKTIYRKHVNLGSLTNTTPKSVAHGITNLSTVVSLTGFATNGTVFLPLPLARYNNFASQIGLYMDTTNVVVEPGNDRTSYTGYVVIEYTKTV
ncbi:siphovirus ReqiPepy6 Gp37-like family protein [Pelotomaculum isophthalicicum JI]|uniref:Siphovirus ReqiPepy6 Gp37-like family protein n=1 Tax=Pelotomaculum isophthalicicum JI TaxID=947010 RepID=A0A9X4H341_9FIRM|nr:siphovirus ReqiPepy6 Gp37-like family protein [Pelotomaculum isophthalicicum]MDF9409360.1 siphovirus ReqiPepy6 Gp37-like family protein [Pelotomaculum isophthalicicum JI]